MKRRSYWIKYKTKKGEYKSTFIKAHTEIEAEGKFYSLKKHNFDLIVKIALN